MSPSTPWIGRISLIIAVLGEAEFMERLLESIIAQNDLDLEVIVVDQNTGNRLQDRLACYQARLNLLHLKSARGLSAARNRGLEHATGGLVAFPDDDCWYPANLLGAVRQRFGSSVTLAGLTCRCIDQHGQVSAGGKGARSGVVTKATVWGRGVSATLFVLRGLVDVVGEFDTSLGLGAPTPYQSGEETDFILRAINAKLFIQYDITLCVHHPLPPDPRKPGTAERAWRYGLGMGRVLRKHRYDPLSVLGYLTTPWLGAAVAVVQGDRSLARMRIARAIGRYQGWRGAEPVHAPVKVLG